MIDHTLKILQRIIKNLIRRYSKEISKIQFRFTPGSGNTKFLFRERRKEEKVSGKEKPVS